MASISEFLTDVDFRGIFLDLEQYGWFHYVFPFMLVYAIVFTILGKVKIFEDKKPVKIIVAVVFGLFAVAFPISDNHNCGHYNSFGGSYAGCTIGDLMMNLFPVTSALTIGILALYIIAAMLGFDLIDFLGNRPGEQNIIKYSLGGLAFVIIGYYFARAMGWIGGYDGSWIDEFLRDPLLWVIVVFGLLFWYISKDEEDEDPDKKRERKEAARDAKHKRDIDWYNATKGDRR